MNEKVTVAVDAMGGDHAPAVEVAGAVAACRQWGIDIVLVGDQERLRAELGKHEVSGLGVSVHHASEVVGMHDSASDAVRKKKDSSIRVAFDLVKQGRAHAVVSAGNSGATMAAGMFVLKRVRGIERPAIAAIMPNLVNETMVLDAGGNVDCRPRHLARFGLMGAVYSHKVLGKERPRIGLLSNGEEESKGNELTRETHALLRQSVIDLFDYVGYVEGRDIYNGSVDVVVCDGFVGNVVLKTSEGLAEALASMLRREMSGSLLAKVGYLFARPAFKRFRRKIDYAEYGGAPLLGIAGTGMICHGGSNEKAIANAIRLAAEYIRKNVNQTLEKALVEIMATEAAAEMADDPAANGN
ncbi:MAG: phosphate acyltransferase PlsX [Deltaproteobacteria bacterium]|nr:MAG: phosphate acyltransferase PlsX [Deltaproteobacteria bacterium]